MLCIVWPFLIMKINIRIKTMKLCSLKIHMAVLKHYLKLFEILFHPEVGSILLSSDLGSVTDGPMNTSEDLQGLFPHPGFKKIGSFHFLTLGTLSLGTQPPFCEEVHVPNQEANMERKQGAWPLAPAELPSNSSHVRF